MKYAKPIMMREKPSNPQSKPLFVEYLCGAGMDGLLRLLKTGGYFSWKRLNYLVLSERQKSKCLKIVFKIVLFRNILFKISFYWKTLTEMGINRFLL